MLAAQNSERHRPWQTTSVLNCPSSATLDGGLVNKTPGSRQGLRSFEFVGRAALLRRHYPNFSFPRSTETPLRSLALLERAQAGVHPPQYGYGGRVDRVLAEQLLDAREMVVFRQTAGKWNSILGTEPVNGSVLNGA